MKERFGLDKPVAQIMTQARVTGQLKGVTFGSLNDNFNNLGFAIIRFFLASWLLSCVLYRRKNLDGVDRLSTSDKKSAGALREARRLFYVGVARPRKEMAIVYQHGNHSPWVTELFKRSQQG
jgi:superfamily I DNA/RNA helicase